MIAKGEKIELDSMGNLEDIQPIGAAELATNPSWRRGNLIFEENRLPKRRLKSVDIPMWNLYWLMMTN